MSDPEGDWQIPQSDDGGPYTFTIDGGGAETVYLSVHGVGLSEDVVVTAGNVALVTAFDNPDALRVELPLVLLEADRARLSLHVADALVGEVHIDRVALERSLPAAAAIDLGDAGGEAPAAGLPGDGDTEY